MQFICEQPTYPHPRMTREIYTLTTSNSKQQAPGSIWSPETHTTYMMDSSTCCSSTSLSETMAKWHLGAPTLVHPPTEMHTTTRTYGSSSALSPPTQSECQEEVQPQEILESVDFTLPGSIWVRQKEWWQLIPTITTLNSQPKAPSVTTFRMNSLRLQAMPPSAWLLSIRQALSTEEPETTTSLNLCSHQQEDLRWISPIPNSSP